MKIKIIVHSKTGNTNFLAEKLERDFIAKNIDSDIEKFEYNINSYAGKKIYHFKNNPKIDDYDTVIFCSPVEAFLLPVEMKDYLERIDSLKNKKVILLVTHYFPYEWMGGSSTISQMKKILESKEGNILGTGIINWSRKDRESQINKIIEKVNSLLSK